MDLDIIIKILKIAFMILIPLILFILSFKYLRQIEDKKNQSSAIYDWNSKWAEIFFESHRNYQSLVLDILHSCDMLKVKVQRGEQNTDEGTQIQLQMNSSMQAIHKAALELRFQISNVSTDSDDIASSTNKIYEMVKSIFNTLEYRPKDILEELSNLKELVKRAHKEAVSNIA